MTSQVAAEWIAVVARALQFVHEHHVLHGAIYPGEIRLTAAGTLKLGGFGAAQKLIPGRPPQEISATWVRPNYQPPEQIAGDWKSLGPAADVYSLGAVLYELLTGQLPYFGLGIQETRAAVLKEVPLAPRNINPRIPSFLDWLCQLPPSQVEPACDRFATAAEMAEAFVNATRCRASAVGQGKKPPTSSRTSATPLPPAISSCACSSRGTANRSCSRCRAAGWPLAGRSSRTSSSATIIARAIIAPSIGMTAATSTC